MITCKRMLIFASRKAWYGNRSSFLKHSRRFNKYKTKYRSIKPICEKGHLQRLAMTAKGASRVDWQHQRWTVKSLAYRDIVKDALPPRSFANPAGGIAFRSGRWLTRQTVPAGV